MAFCRVLHSKVVYTKYRLSFCLVFRFSGSFYSDPLYRVWFYRHVRLERRIQCATEEVPVKNLPRQTKDNVVEVKGSLFVTITYLLTAPFSRI